MYALRSHSFLGVILQDVAFFCAYADTGPEYMPFSRGIVSNSGLGEGYQYRAVYSAKQETHPFNIQGLYFRTDRNFESLNS